MAFCQGNCRRTSLKVAFLYLFSLSCYAQDLQIFEAAGRGDLAALNTLLKGNHNVTWKDRDRRTALHQAAANCQVESSRLLLRAGWDPRLADDKRWTPAMYALKCDDPSTKLVLSRLLMTTANPDERQKEWSMEYAARHGQANVLAMLLKLGSNANELGPHSERPLDITCIKGDVEGTQVLLDHGADPTLRNIEGGTPLHDASLSGNAKVVELLLARGAEINSLNTRDHSTPLHYAASFGRLDVVRTLVEHGAALNIKNSEGKTALALAERNGHTAVALFLHAKLSPP
jgi:ankyrin repeat protein